MSDSDKLAKARKALAGCELYRTSDHVTRIRTLRTIMFSVFYGSGGVHGFDAYRVADEMIDKLARAVVDALEGETINVNERR